jgi:RecB family exonuclease
MSTLRLKRLSASSIQTYYQCLQKYFFNYFSKEKAIENKEALNFGLAVHAALEFIGKALMTGVPLDQHLILAAIEEFDKEAARYQINKQELIVDGKQFIQDRLYRHNAAYPVIAVELNMGDLNCHTRKGVPLNGLIDLILQTDQTSLLVVDYKTSRKAKTPLEIKDDVQLSMYDYMVSQVYPQFNKIWLALEYVRTNLVMTDRTNYEREGFEKRIDGLWEAMGDLTMKDIKPTINIFCPWCGYKHLCQAHKELLEAKVEVKPAAMITSEEELVGEWERLKTLEKLLESRKTELKGWINNKVDDTNRSSFFNDNTTLNWTQGSKTTYEPRVIGPHIPIEDLVNLVYFNKKALEHYIYSKRQDLKPLLEQSSVSNPMAPRVLLRSN